VLLKSFFDLHKPLNFCILPFNLKDDPAVKDPEDMEENVLEGIDDLMYFRNR